jgi:hypothetical protein
VFYLDLHPPWFYVWMYTGAVMRLVLCAERSAVKAPEPAPPLRRPAPRRDPYGWSQPQVRS